MTTLKLPKKPENLNPPGVCLAKAKRANCKWPGCGCNVDIAYTMAYKDAKVGRR